MLEKRGIRDQEQSAFELQRTASIPMHTLPISIFPQRERRATTTSPNEISCGSRAVPALMKSELGFGDHYTKVHIISDAMHITYYMR